MRNAVIENGVVTNLITGSVPGLEVVPDDGTAQVGFLWDGVSFKAPPPVVPQSVTRRQGMAVLIKYGIDTQVDAALSAQLTAANNSGDAASILSAKFAINDWKESQEFQRAWPLIAAMKQVFGWTDAYVDGLFIEADTF